MRSALLCVRVGLMISALTLVGCSANTGPADGFTPPPIMRAWEVTQTEPSPLQEKIIADGTITEAEYKSVVQAAAECMQGRGWETGELSQRDDGLTFAFGVSGAADVSEGEVANEADRIDADFIECAAGTIDPLEMAYIDQNILTGVEREAGYRDLASCLEEIGILDEVSGLTRTEVTQLITDSGQTDAGFACLNEASRLFPATGD